MHVPERPVVEADSPQVVECARAVVVVVAGRTLHVAVKNADLDTGPGRVGELERQVLALAALGEADALYGRERDPVALDRHRLDLSRAEDGDALRPGTAKRGPARLDRVVVAVHDEAGDARGGQAGEAVAESQLCPEPAFGPVIDVACDHEEGHATLQAQPDEGVERGERGFT